VSSDADWLLPRPDRCWAPVSGAGVCRGVRGPRRFRITLSVAVWGEAGPGWAVGLRGRAWVEPANIGPVPRHATCVAASVAAFGSERAVGGAEPSGWDLESGGRLKPSGAPDPAWLADHRRAWHPGEPSCCHVSPVARKSPAISSGQSSAAYCGFGGAPAVRWRLSSLRPAPTVPGRSRV